MKKINKHIEIVSSTMKGLSSMSQLPREAIADVLGRQYSYVKVTIINNTSDLEALVLRNPDLIFLGMKYLPEHPDLGTEDPNKIWLSDYLDNHGIAYTGSGGRAHELESNKQMAKQCVLDRGLSSSPYFVIKQNQRQISSMNRLNFPLFVKPTNRGGGQGIDNASVVNTSGELNAKVSSLATKLQSDALIEEYLPGREFSVAILKEKVSEKFMIMPIEKIAPLNSCGKRFLSGKIKSADSARDAKVWDSLLNARLSTFAMSVFTALGARDYGRIDIRLDSNGAPSFLEANLIPSLIENNGSFPKACVMNNKLNYEAMLLRIVELAFRRKVRDISHAPQGLKLAIPALIPALNQCK